MSTDPMTSTPLIAMPCPERGAAPRLRSRLGRWWGRLWAFGDGAGCHRTEVLHMDDRLLRDIGAPSDMRDAASSARDRAGRIGWDVQPW